MSTAPITLRMPAGTAFLRYARVTAATLADDLGFDVEQIEQLRIAVDELCALAIGDGDDRNGAQIELQLSGERGHVVIEGQCSPVAETPVIDSIAGALLSHSTTSFSLEHADSVCRFRLDKRQAS